MYRLQTDAGYTTCYVKERSTVQLKSKDSFKRKQFIDIVKFTFDRLLKTSFKSVRTAFNIKLALLANERLIHSITAHDYFSPLAKIQFFRVREIS